MVMIYLSAEVEFALGLELVVQSTGRPRTSSRSRVVASVGGGGSWVRSSSISARTRGTLRVPIAESNVKIEPA